MDPVDDHRGRRHRAPARRRRHRPDHPRALHEARRADRLRRVLLPRVARRTASTCRPTRSSSPARTSAAARAASTRRGRSRTTASRRSSRRSFADIFRNNCTKNGLLPVELAAPSSAARSPSAGHAHVDLAAQTVDEFAVRDRPRDQAPPAQRPRRHQPHAPAGGRDRRRTSATASAPGRSRRRCERLGRGDLRPGRRPAGGVGAGDPRPRRRSRPASACSTPAAAAGA